MDRLRRAIDLLPISALGRLPISIDIGPLVQRTQSTIRHEGTALWEKLSLLFRQLSDRVQTKSKIDVESPQPKSPDEIYAALWDRMIRAIGRAVVNHETSDWPQYFRGLRKVTRKLVADSTASGLTDNEKEVLIQRLLERIDRLERYWPAADQELGKKQDQNQLQQPAHAAPGSRSRDAIPRIQLSQVLGPQMPRASAAAATRAGQS